MFDALPTLPALSYYYGEHSLRLRRPEMERMPGRSFDTEHRCARCVSTVKRNFVVVVAAVLEEWVMFVILILVGTLILLDIAALVAGVDSRDSYPDSGLEHRPNW